MPVKRSKAKPRHGRITEADAAAFIATDDDALRRALGLKPWQFEISATADRAKAEGWTVSEIMAHRDQITSELLGCLASDSGGSRSAS